MMKIIARSLIMDMQYPNFYPKYDLHNFPGIANLELDWKISKE